MSDVGLVGQRHVVRCLRARQHLHRARARTDDNRRGAIAHQRAVVDVDGSFLQAIGFPASACSSVMIFFKCA